MNKISRILFDLDSVDEGDLDFFIREVVNVWLTRLKDEQSEDLNNLKFIAIQGSTPEFNDGEPCEHSSYVSFSNRTHNFYPNNPAYEEYDQYSVDSCDKVFQSIDRFFVLKFTTNYKIVIHIDQDKMLVSNVEIDTNFNPGY